MHGDYIDGAGTVWEFRPLRFKTEHNNEAGDPDPERVIFLGPAQEVLSRYNGRTADSVHFFQPLF